MLKRTSLYDTHVAAGARMVDFAGWQMPVQYGAILDEVRSVRSRAGVFDVSHMGQVRVTGSAALAAIQGLFTNDASRLSPGKAQYTLMCREDGGIIDDLIVYLLDDLEYLIVVNASNRETDFAWMTQHGERATAHFEDVSDDYALTAVQGPIAATLLQPIVAGCDLATLHPFRHATATIGGAPMRVARTGYTGEDGFEVFAAPEVAPAIWKALVSAGADPCGLGARDVLRIEASYSLYGHEISLETNPLEAGLGWVVKSAKGDFIGRDAILRSKAGGFKRALRGILPDDAKAIPRQGTVVSTGIGRGIVTSGTLSPTLGRAIGMAYVPAGADGDVTLAMRGKELSARIVPLPFYRRA